MHELERTKIPEESSHCLIGKTARNYPASERRRAAADSQGRSVEPRLRSIRVPCVGNNGQAAFRHVRLQRPGLWKPVLQRPLAIDNDAAVVGSEALPTGSRIVGMKRQLDLYGPGVAS